MLSSAESADPQQADPPGKFNFRIVACVPLLAVAIVFTWLTIDGLSSRRKLRTELAEISHVRYGLLSADRWVEKIVPILDAKIDALDLKAADRSSLRPAVENALYRLLTDVKAKASAKDFLGGGLGGFLGQENALMSNLLVGALRAARPGIRGCGAGGTGKVGNQGGCQEVHKKCACRRREEHLLELGHEMVPVHLERARLRGWR